MKGGYCRYRNACRKMTAIMWTGCWWWPRSAPCRWPWTCSGSWCRSWASTSSSSYPRSLATSAGHAVTRRTMLPIPETRNFWTQSCPVSPSSSSFSGRSWLQLRYWTASNWSAALDAGESGWSRRCAQDGRIRYIQNRTSTLRWLWTWLRRLRRPATKPRARNGGEASRQSLLPHLRRDKWQAAEERATEADMLAAPAAPVPLAPPASTRTLVLPGTAPKGATTQTLVTPPATARGLPTEAEATTEAEGMPEAEATAESVAAATHGRSAPPRVGAALEPLVKRPLESPRWKSGFNIIQTVVPSYIFFSNRKLYIFFVKKKT